MKGGRGKVEEEVVFKIAFVSFVSAFLFFFFEWLLEQGGTCVYRLIKMSLDSEIFGFGYLVGLSRGMREAMRIGISCMCEIGV